MSAKYDHVARLALGTPWFIREVEGSIITSLVRGRIAGERLGIEEIAGRVQAARGQQGPRSGAPQAGPVAIVPIYGVIMPRANLMTEMSGGTTVSAIREMMAEALADQSIAAIIGEFDSPGGSVEGIEELATWIREQRGQKPMVAVVNTTCASAAYYLAAQFDEIVASPSSITGSIGVFTELVEYSKANATEGVTVEIIRAPETKHEINDSQPLSDPARAHTQMLIDDYYGQFVAAVAKGRTVPIQAVRDGYGNGRELTAVRAKAAGMVDRIDTLETTARRLASGRGRAAMQQMPAAALSDVDPAALDSESFPARLALVSASARALVEHARERADMRAKEGRSLTASDRSGLLAVADALHEVADLTQEVPPPPTPPEGPPPSPAWAKAAANRLALARAEYDFELTGATNG